MKKELNDWEKRIDFAARNGRKYSHVLTNFDDDHQFVSCMAGVQKNDCPETSRILVDVLKCSALCFLELVIQKENVEWGSKEWDQVWIDITMIPSRAIELLGQHQS